MAVAAHPTLVYVKATNAAAVAGDEVAGITSATLNQSADLLDVTAFKDTSGWKQRILGLLDGSVELGGMAEFADAPQSLIRSSFLSGASIWVTVHFNPSGAALAKGFQVECKVASANHGSEVADKVSFDASFQFTAAPVAV
jgi:predicted secreted protein